MKFGPLPTPEAEGAILAHSTRFAGTTFKKGRVLSADDVAALAAAGIDSVIAARLEAGDVPEDEAALAVARALAGPGIEAGKAFTGRCNLIAAAHGLLVFDRDRIDAVNLVDEAITVATLPAFDVVTPGQMVATIKIIPFAAPEAALARVLSTAENGGPVVSVAAFRETRVGLVLTHLAGQKEKVLDNTSATAGARVEAAGSRIVKEIRCRHDADEVAAAITALRAEGAELILVFGASATIDRGDVVPAGVVAAGGHVDHFGMPVDPGNLLFVGGIEDVPVVGMPGCARSPKLNGFDWVLWRLLAGIAVAPGDLMRMGAGGLLKEIPDRGVPRAESPAKAAKRSGPRVAALILAAGASTRMGTTNKLVADVAGKPMVRRVAEAAAASRVSGTVVVLGHQADAIRRALAGIDATLVENPDYAAGLSTSLKAGLAALPRDIDGVLVCLGDMPEVTAGDIDGLIDAFDPLEGRAICVPVFGRKRGNPVLWARAFFDEMAALAGDVGARHLLEKHADEVCEVTAGDDGVLFDVDTPERLAELDGRAAAKAG